MDFKVKIIILPQHKIDSMLELATQIQDNSNLLYQSLQNAICSYPSDLQKIHTIIEQVITNYEQQIYHTIPNLLEKCENLKKLDLGKRQSEQIKLIEDALEVVKKDNQNILKQAIKLRWKKYSHIH